MKDMTKISRTALLWFRSDNRKPLVSNVAPSAIQNPKRVGLSLIAFVLVVSGAVAQAQQPEKISWIGYLAGTGSGPSPAFIQGLRDLGYIEGKNIGFVFRTAEDTRERYADLAAELARLKVDIIVADSTGRAQAVKKATSTIPIVMTGSITDPIGTGLVTSLARPGGNVTGLTNVSGELGGKVLELLKEVVPKLNRVAILRTAASTADNVFVKEAEVPARALGVQLIPLMVQGADDFEGAFRAMTKERANGLVVRLLPNTYSVPFKRVADLTMKNRLPSIAQQFTWVDAGGLMSYGSDPNISYRRAATYVDKILKGAKPADLPVEAPTKFELKINLKTANQIGVTIPPNVLARADKIIK
jgi:putative ABC transport system substrate-binding protein